MIEKIKELTKDTAIYGISTIVGRFLGFLLVPFYTHFISTSDFGIYSNVYAYLAFLNIVYIYGMDAAFLKYFSIADAGEKKRTFSTPYIFVTVSTIILSLLMFVLRAPIAAGMELSGSYDNLVYYLILILLFDTLVLIPFANLRLARRAKKFAAIKLTNIILNLVLNLVLIIKYKMGIEAIFISNLAASFITFVILIPEIVRNLELKIDISILKKMLKFGIPYLPASIAATIVQVVDRPIVLALTNASTLGIYQANYKLGIFMMLFVSMFQYAWQPFFLNNAKAENAKEIFSKVLTIFVLAASVIWIILTLFIDNFATFHIYHGKSIIGEEFLGGLIIVPIVLLGYLFHGMYVNFQAGLYIEEKTKYFPYITGLGALLNVVVNFALIPVLGIMGAALATLASYIAMASSSFFISQRFYKIKYEYAKIARLLALIFLTGGVFYYLALNNIITIYLKFLLLFFFTASILLLRIVRKEELFYLSRLLVRKK